MADYSPEYLRRMAVLYATAAGYNADLFVKQINQESGFRTKGPDGKVLTSSAGAQGIAQFMPGTAKALGVDPTDPLASLRAAAEYMAKLTKKFGSERGALVAYNAGEGTAARYVDKGASVLPSETKQYLAVILGAPKSGALPDTQEGQAKAGKVQPLTVSGPGEILTTVLASVLLAVLGLALVGFGLSLLTKDQIREAIKG